MTEASPTRKSYRWLRVAFNTLVCIAILSGSAFGVWLIYRTEPTAQQIETKRKSAALVETILVERDSYSPQLTVLGTVRPVRDIVVSPRIRGQVIELSPAFVPGGMLSCGDLLLQVDPADFENAVSIRQSELEQVEADWEIEVGRQKLAEQELELLGDSIKGINRALVLREPQSASLKSQLSAAKAAVERAKLDLERTKLVAPFDAQVLRQSINVGSQVGPGDDLGQLVGIDEYWVIAAVPVRDLRWIQFPKDDQLGSSVTLHNTDAWGPDVSRQGRVERMIGSLDQQTRLARVVVVVGDPLGRTSGDPPLILDTLIEARIRGVAIDDIVRLEREYVHDGDTVWVMKENQLEIRETNILFRDAKYAYVRDGLDAGDEVVTTTLATVANGVQLRRVDEAEPSEAEPSEASTDIPSESDDDAENQDAARENATLGSGTTAPESAK